ncbi:hypothetical protein CBL_07993 [Carabus blaptoides fortunei]
MRNDSPYDEHSCMHARTSKRAMNEGTSMFGRAACNRSFTNINTIATPCPQLDQQPVNSTRNSGDGQRRKAGDTECWAGKPKRPASRLRAGFVEAKTPQGNINHVIVVR